MKNTIAYLLDATPSKKKVWVIEQTTKPRPATYAFFVRASNIRNAHAFGSAKFGKGISFRTREMNVIEKQIYKVHDIIEAE